MLTREDMAEAMYAMDILAAKLDGGNRLEDWKKETGLSGAPDFMMPEDCKLGLYESWLASKSCQVEAFRNLVSSFVFLLCREAFGRCEALDDLVCDEEVFS